MTPLLISLSCEHSRARRPGVQQDNDENHARVVLKLRRFRSFYRELPVDIIDTHQHLWDLNRLRLPWIEPGSILDRSYLTEDYRDATAAHRVTKSVYMEVDVAPGYQAAEADLVLGLCASEEHPTVAAVIGGHPGTDRFRQHVGNYLGNPAMKGVRQILNAPGMPRGHCLKQPFVDDLRWLGEQGLCFDICIRPNELDDAAELAKRCPETHFVLDHCGNAEVHSKDDTAWKKGIDAVVQQPNILCKVSGIIVSAKPGEWTASDLAPWVNHVLDAFGPQRVMFGGDWPVCTQTASLEQWVNTLLEIVADRSLEEKRNLLHDNAVSFYALPG